MSGTTHAPIGSGKKSQLFTPQAELAEHVTTATTLLRDSIILDPKDLEALKQADPKEMVWGQEAKDFWDMLQPAVAVIRSRDTPYVAEKIRALIYRAETIIQDQNSGLPVESISIFESQSSDSYADVQLLIELNGEIFKHLGPYDDPLLLVTVERLSDHTASPPAPTQENIIVNYTLEPREQPNDRHERKPIPLGPADRLRVKRAIERQVDLENLRLPDSD